MAAMTEALWLAAPRPDRMLSFLRGKVSYRKVVLFNCACCRRVWNTLGEKDRAAVAHCEERSEEPDSLPEVCAIYRPPMTLRPHHTTSPTGVPGVAFVPEGNWEKPAGESCLRWDLDGNPKRMGLGSAASEALELIAPHAPPAPTLRATFEGRSAEERRAIFERMTHDPVRLAEQQAQADLVRDIFGNPFRPTDFAPVWRTETVLGIARELHTSRDFTALPVLADALQDAGCDDDAALAHCRGAGPHARGCWVVDGLLRKT